jgi:hypothetical protein
LAARLVEALHRMPEENSMMFQSLCDIAGLSDVEEAPGRKLRNYLFSRLKLCQAPSP